MKSILTFIILGALLFSSGCGSHKKENKEGTKFLVTSPLKMDTVITREYVCQIRSVQHIELRALERGYLQKIYIDEGQFVQKGQLMFQIMPLVYKAEMDKAQAEADLVDIEYQTTKALADSNIVSRQELAMVKARLQKAKAELELRKVHMGFTEIRAPFSGLIDRFHVREGSLLEDGELLTSLSDNNEMWVYFNVPEAEYLDYKRKMNNDKMLNVELIMANYELFEYPGVVRTIEADFNNETGTIAFRATFPNPDRLLRHGETGNVRVTVPMKNTLIIPQKATFEILDKKYVYVLDKDNVLKARKVTILAELPDLYIIQSGLVETDKILLEGLRLVKENDKITYEYQKPELVFSRLKLPAE